jgi:hypothetical protein
MEFNIENYLNLLPEKSKNKNLNYIPSLIRFKNLKKIYCSDNNLTYLPLLNETLELLCYEKQLPNYKSEFIKIQKTKI